MSYLLLVIVGICIGVHIWIMFKGHKKHEEHDEKNKENKHGGCCH